MRRSVMDACFGFRYGLDRLYVRPGLMLEGFKCCAVLNIGEMTGYR